MAEEEKAEEQLEKEAEAQEAAQADFDQKLGAVAGMPRLAARAGDPATSVGPMDSIAMGSATVMIGGRPAARL